MKKLTIFFCGTLALAACGNGIEKKANEKLMVAQAAYERGDYEEAKSQIDSIKILYPKAFEARKAGQALMLDVETKAQQKTLAYLDSALRAKTEEFNAIKDKFILEKDAEYQQVGNYLWPTQTVEKKHAPFFPPLSGGRAGKDEHDFHLLRFRQHPSRRGQSDCSRRQLRRNSRLQRQL